MGPLINETLTKLRTLSPVEFASVWNNQVADLLGGDNWSFPDYSIFVQLGTDPLTDIGGNAQGSDISVILHLVRTGMYNGNPVNRDVLDEALTIFDFRDAVVVGLRRFKPTKGSIFVKTAEGQDYDHTNVYHYTITYKTHYIDLTEVAQDYFSTPPTEMKYTVNFPENIA